jgi:transcriptional regulator with XRE-family HTH domain
VVAALARNIERGKENPTLDLLFSLADALKVSFGEMCDLKPVEEMDQKKLRSAVREMLRTAGPEQLRVAMKV